MKFPQSLTNQYMDIVYNECMDFEDELRCILELLERVAPDALEREIKNMVEYLDSWKESEL